MLKKNVFMTVRVKDEEKQLAALCSSALECGLAWRGVVMGPRLRQSSYARSARKH